VRKSASASLQGFDYSLSRGTRERLVTQDEILEALWPERMESEVIKQYIRGIRKLLATIPKSRHILRPSQRGYSYRSVSDESAAFPKLQPKGIVGRETALAELGACLAALAWPATTRLCHREAGIEKKNDSRRRLFISRPPSNQI